MNFENSPLKWKTRELSLELCIYIVCVVILDVTVSAKHILPRYRYSDPEMSLRIWQIISVSDLHLFVYVITGNLKTLSSDSLWFCKHLTCGVTRDLDLQADDVSPEELL